ncbi:MULTISPECIES: cytochrome P450 [Streptomyces]|uniref:Cytochrome P450 n=1 Tax=Streptomyces tendae TaxID=1932 RepID=A0A6B3QWJ4_STRTE|nr:MULTISPECIES: cytochrome P450 [unclassified Streptomyces]MBQ0964897.1 cytochrome P450 [Streptomyces sp. RK74B]MBQ1003705.1 cytochrome P450 [Streptomyces sp. RK23]NEV91570.1 cytochrome P450 [Streptomyces tendae]BET51173.1 cytochrome P450 [Kitasatospora aureofaciens]
MTPESHSPTGTGEPLLEPPPGCPAHGLGPGGLHRLHEADDLEELYEKLRAQHGPVAPALLHDDVPMWVVLGHAENLHMVSTPSQFCRDSRIWSPLNEGMVKPDHPLMPHIAWQPICSHAEGDEHKRLRGAVTSAMSDLDYRELRRHIKRYTQRVVNRFCEEGRADLVSQFAEHLPMGVMCHLLGMPEEYNDRLVEAARDTLKGTETAIASHAYVMEALGRLTATRRAAPADDIAGRLVTHPAGLTDDEVREHLRVVLLAAYEATVNLIANVMRVVLTDPGFRAQLSGGQMTVPQAVEQSLWDEPPFSTVFAYFAKQETELGGQRIRAGDGLLLGIAPGNVDPRIRPDLDASMMGNRAHLAFGGGPHECPGQDIGRAIADAGIDALLMRLPDLRLDCDEDDLRWRSSIASRHLVELPVRFEPRAQQDIMQQPSHAPTPQRHAPWHVGLPKPEQGAQPPRPSQPPQPASVTAAEPQQAPGADQAPARGAWQRFLRWWRGY